MQSANVAEHCVNRDTRNAGDWADQSVGRRSSCSAASGTMLIMIRLRKATGCLVGDYFRKDGRLLV